MNKLTFSISWKTTRCINYTLDGIKVRLNGEYRGGRRLCPKRSKMPDVNDIHKFYEANLPEYERRHLLDCNRAFLREMGISAKKPIKKILDNFRKFQEFVVFDWLGESYIREEKMGSTRPQPEEKKTSKFGPCSCGGLMVKRQNRSDKSFFLGCSKWPKCNKTKPFLH